MTGRANHQQGRTGAQVERVRAHRHAFRDVREPLGRNGAAPARADPAERPRTGTRIPMGTGIGSLPRSTVRRPLYEASESVLGGRPGDGAGAHGRTIVLRACGRSSPLIARRAGNPDR